VGRLCRRICWGERVGGLLGEKFKNVEANDDVFRGYLEMDS
jgi:hypothetical protein